MLIEQFSTDDIPAFMDLAAAEGWLADPWEFSFLLATFSEGCCVARESEAGAAIGFVTSLRHERSGWIGNLLVHECFRGNGIGEALFLRAVDALRKAGTETLWLTASKSGKSLYEKHGFSSIDTIKRWSGSAGQNRTDHKAEAEGDVTGSSVSSMDHQAWGDRRDGLLAAVIGRGELLITENSFLVIQPCGASTQFGPFSARDCAAAEQLLDCAFLAAPQGTKVCLDVPESNHGAKQILTMAGMCTTGTSELMFCGVKPDYRPELIYGLATMGSCG